MGNDSWSDCTENCPQRFEDLSFDGWKNLHDSKPELFEKCRRKLLKDLVDSAPERTKARLNGLIFQMEAKSQRCKSPVAYNIQLAAMMMDTLGELRVQISRLGANNPAQSKQNQSPVQTAKVLSFNRDTKSGRDT